MLYNDGIKAHVVGFDVKMWKSVEGFPEDPKKEFETESFAYVVLIFGKRARLFFVHGDGDPPYLRLRLLGVKTTPVVSSNIFRFGLHHLLSLEGSRHSVHKMLPFMANLPPSAFTQLKSKISNYVCARAREAYFAGCNVMRIVARVKISETRIYRDECEAIWAFRWMNNDDQERPTDHQVPDGIIVAV